MMESCFLIEKIIQKFGDSYDQIMNSCEDFKQKLRLIIKEDENNSDKISDEFTLKCEKILGNQNFLEF